MKRCRLSSMNTTKNKTSSTPNSGKESTAISMLHAIMSQTTLMPTYGRLAVRNAAPHRFRFCHTSLTPRIDTYILRTPQAALSMRQRHGKKIDIYPPRAHARLAPIFQMLGVHAIARYSRPRVRYPTERRWHSRPCLTRDSEPEEPYHV
jgi:hypothetical protein